MAGNSTLNPDRVPGVDRAQEVPKGHDTGSLGPSDSSDTASDMTGPGLIDDDALGLDRGTNEDEEAGRDDIADAGASVGDEGMDESSDRYGTGTRRSAGKQPSIGADADRGFDRVIGPDEGALGGHLDEAEEAKHRHDDEPIDRDEDSSGKDEDRDDETDQASSK